MQVTVFEVLTLIYCCYGSFVSGGRPGENAFSLDSIISLPYETDKLLHREKRQGGGGIIPFRPLFVYRQQQREQQEKWKEIEARKKLKQQLVQYDQYQDTVKQQQQLFQSPPDTVKQQQQLYQKPLPTRYTPTTQYSSYNNYPSSQYSSYSYPSYYAQYVKDLAYQKELSNYYQDYYDGYEYSSYY